MGKKKEGGGAPGWIVTFADLMSLLLTFFVLLLSFAEMDVVKFKKAVGSIRNAFGVQSNGQYIDFVTSNNPFQQDFAQGAVQVEDYDFPQPQLAPDFENFCELEQQRIKRDEVELKTMGVKITEALTKSGLDEFVDLEINRGRLKMKMKFSNFFNKGKVKLDSDAKKVMERVVDILDQQDLPSRMTFTHYSPGKLSKAELKEWRLSSQRIIAMATEAKQADFEMIKEVGVQSRKPASRSQSSDMWNRFDIILAISQEKTK
ncbi:MAG: hypothetical protein HRT45_03865 [Bdellovibrionales bacterium]|nr:hypothetical protein [Bdellovibrionales bacterium]